MSKQTAPVHPGEILREEFLIPLKLSAGKVAKATGIPRTRIERVAEQKTGITADTALRLAAFFGNSADFWTNLQSHYDLMTARKEIGKQLEKIEQYKDEAA
jgi:addiction module HigA family antidote